MGSDVEGNGVQGSLNCHLFWGGNQTSCKCMVIFRDFPYNSALFGLVI